MEAKAPTYTPPEWERISKLISDAAKAAEYFDPDELERYAEELRVGSKS